MFDVYYIGNNDSLKEVLPFATQVISADQVTPRTKMFWLVEPNIQITDYSVFEYRPQDYDQTYEHVWKWSSKNYGGVKLLPRVSAKGTKEINRVVCRKSFDILHTPTPGQYFEQHPYATHVWCVDPEYKLNSDIDWAPDNFEPMFIHSFHLRDQLEHKYPEKEGGIKLYPRDWQSAKIKYHTFLDAGVAYPVLYVDNVNNYTQRDKFADEYVWLIDREHKINKDTLDWVPNPFEREYIHSFRMPYQLGEKYPQAMGGIRLVPRNWQSAELKIHPSCPVKDEKYDVFYISDDEFNEETYADLSNRSKSEWFWVVDRQFEFNGELLFVPAAHEQKYIHVFKIPGMLEERYLEQVTDAWDNRCSGVRLVNKNFDMTKHKYQSDVVPVRYDIFYTDDINNYDTYARKSRTKMFWLIDREHTIDAVFKYLPRAHDQRYIHIFKFPGQLEHKYPRDITNVSDNRCGGIKLVPVKYNTNDAKFVNRSPVGTRSYPVLRVDDINDLSKVTEDCWVIDSEYQIVDNIMWSPPDFQRNFMHVFHVKGQLKHKYPQAMGGARWVPVDWNGHNVIHNDELDIGKTYPIIRVDDPTNFADVHEDCWLIDRLYAIDSEVIQWQPTVFERNMIHVFHIKGQLRNKYAETMGGAYWVPANHAEADIKVHSESLEVNGITYPVNFVEQPNNFKTAPLESWWVDREYRIDEHIAVIPWQNEREKNMVHVYHVKDQLQHKYPEKMGGAYWIPAVWNGDFKVHEEPLDVAKQYPIVYADEPANPPNKVTETWVLDKLYSIGEKIRWVPNDFEKDMIHVFHIKGQLASKYTEKMGGAYWYPAVEATEIKIHDTPLDLAPVDYPVHRVDNPADFSNVTEDCWLIDKDYVLNDKITVIPWQNETEKNMIHVYQVRGQLEHKYPEEMGGVYWVPVNWDGNYVIHNEYLPVKEKEYPIYFVDDPTIPPNNDEDCWVADSLYRINPPINWIPSEYDRDKIHVFHVYGQLTSKYTESMGGVYWYPADRNNSQIKVQDNPLQLQVIGYPVYRVSDPADFSNVTEDCWLIDKDYVLNDKITVIPWQNETEKNMIHVYQVRGQLEHKYPEEMGGVYWVPATWKNAQLKIHNVTPFGDNLKFDIYHDEEIGRKKSTTGWFWVIDPNVDLLPDFKLDYIPKIWDAGKTHVWQKLNPITGRQYDYAGVMLCPKIPQSKGRPKYIREAACIQKMFPVFKLDQQQEIIEQLTYIDNIVENSMYWVIDPFTRVHPDFKFEYYPTQWDTHNVHVFSDEDGAFRNVRLIPKGTFVNSTLTSTDIANNSFKNLKQINTIGSLRPQWPVVHLRDVTKTELVAALQEYANQEVPFLWTVDPDVGVEKSVLEAGYLPDLVSMNKIHVWQRQNPHTGKVHSYGGLRLWPTNRDYTNLTTSQIRLNKLFDMQYVKQVGSTYTPYEIVFISYKELGASNAYNRLAERFSVTWVKDVEGIFEAHKAAANSISSKMFWVVDADAQILDTFDFSYIPDSYDQDVTHVWASRNPITGQEYGYGGVKLFNRMQVLDATNWGLDFTTGLSRRFKAMPEVSCVTRFNVDGLSTWRSAFRECVKLTLKDDAESRERLEGWLHPVPDAYFRHDAMRGAEQGRTYATANRNNLEALAKINDYAWLEQRYQNGI